VKGVITLFSLGLSHDRNRSQLSLNPNGWPILVSVALLMVGHQEHGPAPKLPKDFHALLDVLRDLVSNISLKIDYIS